MAYGCENGSENNGRQMQTSYSKMYSREKSHKCDETLENGKRTTEGLFVVDVELGQHC